VRSQLNRGRRLISAFVPALARWRASRARMFHSWRHRSGLSNEAAILIPRFGGSNPPAAASLYASARVEPPLFGDPVTHHTTDAQPITKSARSPQFARVGGQLGGRPVSVRLTPIFPSASVPHCSRRAIFRRRGTKPSGDAGQGAPSLLLVFNNSVRRSRPSCCRPVGAHGMSGELVKLALAGAAASVLIWVLSFLAPHCVPEHVGHLIQLAAC
jgi:hypothetical protein